MFNAPVGDDVFEDDPTVLELEKRVSDLLGHEAGLYCCTGTMSNQLAMRCHLRPLDSIIIHHYGHIYDHEAGGVAYHCQATVRPLAPEPGHKFLNAKQVEENIVKDNDVHNTPTRVVCLENTLQGMVMPFEEIKKIREVCLKNNLKTHLDGARIWNASVATGIPLKEYGSQFDSISVCFSKGMGAPVGSVLVGNKDFIRKARHFRKVMGGGWRQAGVLAGACLYALENNWKRMSVDHDNAKFLSDKLVSLGFKLSRPTETNMVWIDSKDLGFSIKQWSQAAKDIGVIIMPSEGTTTRLVTHLQITRQSLETFVDFTEKFLKSIKEIGRAHV